MLTEADGDVYDGNFKDDKKWGDGIMKRWNGKEITGVWHDGRLDGKACYKYAKSKTGVKPAEYAKDFLIKSVKDDKWYDHFFVPFLLMLFVNAFIYYGQKYDEPVYYFGAAVAYAINLIESG